MTHQTLLALNSNVDTQQTNERARENKNVLKALKGETLMLVNNFSSPSIRFLSFLSWQSEENFYCCLPDDELLENVWAQQMEKPEIWISLRLLWISFIRCFFPKIWRVLFSV